MKKTLAYIGTPLIIAVAFFTIFDDSSKVATSEQTHRDKIDTQDTSLFEKKESDITYEQSISSDTQENSIKRRNDIEVLSYDKEKRFEISIINPNIKENTIFEDYIYVKGEIDSNAFTLRIPKYLTELGSEGITLQIKEIDSNVTTSIEASFLNTIDEDMINRLKINSEDLENYEHTMTPRLLP